VTAVNSAIPVPQTFVGLGKQTERSKPNETPAYWLPVSGPKYKPDIMMLMDEGLRGSMVKEYDAIPALRFDSHGWDQHLYLDSLGSLVQAALGAEKIAAAPMAETTLSVDSKVGDTKITVASVSEIKANETYVVIGTAGTPPATGFGGSANLQNETRLVTGVSGSELTLAYPLEFAHVKTTTKVKGLTTHVFSLLNNAPSTGNQPSPWTLIDNGGETGQRMLTDCQLETLTFTGSADALPKAAVTWFGNAAVAPTTAKTSSFTAVEATPGFTVQTSLGGTQVEYVVSWEVALKRNVANVPALTGTQAYYQHFAGPLEATTKLTILQNLTNTELAKFEAGTETSIDITLSDLVNGFAMTFHGSKVKYTVGEVDRSKEYVEVTLDAVFLPNTTDAKLGASEIGGGVSPLQIAVANAKTDAY
jgi:hypothetical protein